MVDVQPDWKPETEGGIGRAKARGRSRARTHRSTWAELHARKGGTCRLAGLGGCYPEGTYELHHLLSKARGGPNEAWNLAPLCKHHHLLVTGGSPLVLRHLAENLTDDEYAGLIEHGGEGVMARLFGVMSETPR